jgi:hypothetical protein
MVADHLKPLVEDLAEMEGMPDHKEILGKMKRKIQNNRVQTKSNLPAGYEMDVVDALLLQHFPNTPGAQGVRVTDSVRAKVANMDSSVDGADLLVSLYNQVLPKGHDTLELDGSNDPRLLELAADT